jgi:zinc/manganese transport system substrate-binding protein
MSLWIAFISALQAHAALQVVTTTQDLAWVAREIGGARVEVQSLLQGSENPHYSNATPEFIRRAANADVLCAVGLELEVGWLPKVLTRSGNAKVQPGGKGFCEAGRSIETLEKPTSTVTRAMGDVHPQGNPHFWLSPTALAQAAGEISQALVRADPEGEKVYTEGLKRLRQLLEKVLNENRKKLVSILKEHSPLMEYHREFVYFTHAYGLKSIGSIEEKPGVPPSAGRIAQVAKEAKDLGVRLAIAAPYSPSGVLERFREISGIPVVILPTSVQPMGGPKDYPELQTRLIQALLDHMKVKNQ